MQLLSTFHNSQTICVTLIPICVVINYSIQTVDFRQERIWLTRLLTSALTIARQITAEFIQHKVGGFFFSLPFFLRQPENIITLVLVFLWGLCAKSDFDYQALNAQQYISVWLNQHKSAQAYTYRLGDYFPFTARQSKQQEAELSPAVLLPAEQALCRYWSMSRLRDGMPKPTKTNSPRTVYFFCHCSPKTHLTFPCHTWHDIWKLSNLQFSLTKQTQFHVLDWLHFANS